MLDEIETKFTEACTALGLKIERLHVDFIGARKTIQIDVSIAEPKEMFGDASPADAAILEVLSSLKPNETLTGEELAKRAGYAFGGWFRKRLAELAKEKKIGTNGRSGYSCCRS